VVSSSRFFRKASLITECSSRSVIVRTSLWSCTWYIASGFWIVPEPESDLPHAARSRRNALSRFAGPRPAPAVNLRSVSSTARPLRLLVALTAGVAVLGAVAGCGPSSGIGLAKVTFQRTTIPAGATGPADSGGSTAGSGGVPITGSDDAAFAPAKLRLISPCGMLDADTVGALGSDSDPVLVDFGECDDDMSDADDNDLDITLTLGDQIDTHSASRTIDGLPVSEDHNDEDCAERVITQQDPTLAVTVDVDYESGDPCATALKLVPPIISRIRANPPLLSGADATLAGVDPCGTVDTGTVHDVVGSDADMSIEGLHECTWDNDGTELSVDLTEGPPPNSDDTEGTPKPISFAGISGFEVSSTDVFPSCEIKWTVRPGTEDDDQQVDVEFDDIENQHLDTCGKALTVATAAAGKLPRPTS
jgi:hypothetical protein